MSKLYLNNKDLYAELIVSKAQGKLTRQAGKMFELLAKRAIMRMKYYNPDDKQDCYQSGLLDMYQNWMSFDEEKSVNAFAYFTEIFKRGAAKGFNKYHKKKGDDKNEYKLLSIDRANGGEGIHTL